MLPDLLVALISIGVFVLPGYALVSLLLGRQAALADRLCLACGASLAIYPLALLGLTLLGVRSGPLTIAIMIALALVVIAAGAVWCQRDAHTRRSQSAGVSLEEILLLVVFLVTLVLRLLAVQGQSYPAWTDGYHHTLISQIIRDSGFIPASYRPYAPLDHFTYHFGFHGLVVAWAWLTGLPTPLSVTLVAQIVNSLSVPAGYLFAKTLTGRRDVGLFTAVVVGLVAIMPAYYVNWSRNTQLEADVILPLALAALIQTVHVPAAHRRWAVLGAVLLAGVFLVHYAIWAFAVVFLLVYVVAWLIEQRQCLRQQLPRLGWLVGGGVASGVLVLPWMWHMVSAYLLPRQIMATEVPSFTPAEIQQAIVAYYGPVPLAWLLTQVIRPVEAALAYLGTLVGMVAHRRAVLVLLAWFILLFVLATPDWTGLPYGLALYNNFAIAIATYLVFSIFIALLVAYVIDRFGARWQTARPALMVVLVAVACVTAGLWQPSLLDANQVYVAPADEAAAQWIAGNLPADATIAIRPHQPTPLEVIGVDGGYWLPYLAGRQVTVPPMVYFSEGDPAYVNQVLAFTRAMLGVNSIDELADLLRAHDITYVYIGPRQPDNQRRLLYDAPQFEVIYDRDNATVFRLR